MARSNSGDQPNPNLPSPFQTPPGGALSVPPAGPYGPPPTAHGSAAKAGPTPLGMLNALKRRWVLASFLGLLLGGAVAAGVWFLMPAGKHQARALVELKPQGPEVGGRSSEDFDTYRRNQIFILKTRDLLSRTVNEPSVASLDIVRNADDPIRVLEDAIKVDIASPYILSVTMTGDNPDSLKTLLDMLVKKFQEESGISEDKKRQEKLKQLDELAEQLRAEIDSEEKSINRLAEANVTLGGKDADMKLAQMQQHYAKLSAEVYAGEVEDQEAEAALVQLQKKLADKRFEFEPLMLHAELNNDKRVAEALARKLEWEYLLKQDLKVAGLKPGDEEPPTIKNLRTKVDEAAKEVATTMEAVRPEITARLSQLSEQQLRTRVADLQEKLQASRTRLAVRKRHLDAFQSGMKQATNGSFNLAQRLRELEPKRDSLNRVETQRVQLQVEKKMDTRVGVKEWTFVVLNQNLNKKTMLSAATGVAAFLLVIVVIGFLEWRTRRIDGVDQVVSDLGMRVIGTVPSFPNKASLKAAEAAGNANWRFVLNESINSTRTMLLHTARKEAMQVVMVTSATQGEGKTSLSSQLGTSMAAAGMRTLIVDCDLRNPSIHKLFDLSLTVGVSEVLCQEADASEAVQPTAVPNLWVIPAGQCSTRVITALAQGHPLETLFNRLRGQFDFIIVDSCPVLPVADALLIGQHVDGVLFSIMQDISQLPKVQVASEKLHLLNVPMLGAVVNNVSGGSAYYAYGYNYVKQLPA